VIPAASNEVWKTGMSKIKNPPPFCGEGHLYGWVSKYWEINFPTQY
jgi:hypothetical protein